MFFAQLKVHDSFHRYKRLNLYYTLN